MLSRFNEYHVYVQDKKVICTIRKIADVFQRWHQYVLVYSEIKAAYNFAPCLKIELQ